MRHPFPMNLIIPAEQVPGRGPREHLTAQLRAALLSGKISAGDPMPSSRVLAAAVGVSRGTVVSVYEDLAGEGYVEIVPGSGTYVAEGLPRLEATPAPEAPPEHPPASDPGERAGARRNLLPGSPATAWSRNRDWVAAWRRAVTEELPSLPPPAAGTRDLRALIAQHLRTARGVVCAPEDVIVTAGTSDGLALLLQAQRSGGDARLRIATENPGYPTARRVIRASGGTPVPIPVRDGGMDLDALRAAPGPFSAVLLTPSHQYPLGGRLPVTARLELLAWAKATGTVVFEDDYDSEFRHGAPQLPAIASLDHEGRVVLIGSFSKTLSPWLRCGYVVIQDPEL
ncbi:aminotransferase-like domain-containing protein, partial [Leucobacter sp. M11]|uniref:aminotransferase-like domain-containing protein n=1 Tax=Leucobacter sp. M11 TaxID=2993565 RepID=UPI002D80FB42